MAPMSPERMRGPAPKETCAVMMACPAVFWLLVNSGMARPAYITSDWRSPKPKRPPASAWLPGIGSSFTTFPVIASMAVFSVFSVVLVLNVDPPSRLVLNELATRA